ncbi:hypothetical protein PRZ48_007224 [Zasmidium cellare]|uniref:Xylanolytic transcriptional activator regulatory domain-containing protein n=1 Tax=Zasmidium cellare TaxID=395010 RepID=A0ABR0EJL0_ZASCE|nr:hypothetical protein PRZ48_007224 [Zasmidium cellare]
MTAEDISSIVGTPEEIKTFDSNQAWTGNDAMVDSLWLQDPAWEWPPMIQDAPIMSPEPSSLRSTLLKDNIEPNFILDPALNLASQPPTSSPMQASNLYDEVSYESSHMSWYGTRPNPHFDNIPVSNSPKNPSSSKSHSADQRRTPRSHSTPTPIPTCTLLGEAARIAQETTIKELVSLYTSTMTSENQSKYFWHSMSSKLELAFNMSGLVPCRDSNVFEHFVSLFGKFFHVGFPIKSNDIPPHLTLVMAVIGAAYAGPKAETFHTRVMGALRVALVDVAKTSEEGSFWVVQSLTLLLVAMLYFGDRKVLEVAPGLVGLVVEMARKIQLFGDGGDVQRRRVAYGVVRLDAVVACLFSRDMLLGEVERRGYVCQTGKRNEDVLDRLLMKAGGIAPVNVPAKYLQWEATWMGSSP